MHVFEVVSVGHKPHFEKVQTHFEKLVVVAAFKNRVVDVANKVLEERSDHHVDNLTNFQVDILGQCGSSMVLLEFHATCDVLFSGLKIEFI